ncbi:MAG: hypothetical protein NWE78_03855 [Candidatus Bathyarchaeota archaeon]|nr:hypothetical protein [Candidatus Bathyarchaeota archaeon]
MVGIAIIIFSLVRHYEGKESKEKIKSWKKIVRIMEEKSEEKEVLIGKLKERLEQLEAELERTKEKGKS